MFMPPSAWQFDRWHSAGSHRGGYLCAWCFSWPEPLTIQCLLVAWLLFAWPATCLFVAGAALERRLLISRDISSHQRCVIGPGWGEEALNVLSSPHPSFAKIITSCGLAMMTVSPSAAAQDYSAVFFPAGTCVHFNWPFPKKLVELSDW